MAGDIVDTVYGPMSAQFAKSPLGDLCVADGGVQTGPFGSQLHASDYVEYGTPIITVEHLGENRIIHNNLPRITDEDKKRLARYTLITGDIVVSRVGSVDRRAIVHPEENGWLFSGRCLRVRPHRKKIDAGFLSWFFGLPTFQEHIRQIAVGATMPSLNTKILGDVPIYYPPSLKEQQAIAHILGTLDDKIELNRRMNQTLESMARAIFKSWFVDFDPVRAKAEGRDPGLPDHIAALFPHEFEESELGEIPRGWQARVVADFCEIARGGAWGDGEPFDGAVEALCLRGVDLEHLRQSGWADAPRRWFKRKHIEDRKMDERDVLVAASGVGPLGRSLWVSRDLESAFDLPLIYSNFCKRLRCGSVARAVYIDRWLQLMREDGEIWTYATGTSIPNLDCRSLLEGKVIVAPPDPLLDSYAAFVRPIAGRLYSPESRYLAALRDGLLPKLISGELRAPDAERLMEARI